MQSIHQDTSSTPFLPLLSLSLHPSHPSSPRLRDVAPFTPFIFAGDDSDKHSTSVVHPRRLPVPYKCAQCGRLIRRIDGPLRRIRQIRPSENLSGDSGGNSCPQQRWHLIIVYIFLICFMLMYCRMSQGVDGEGGVHWTSFSAIRRRGNDAKRGNLLSISPLIFMIVNRIVISITPMDIVTRSVLSVFPLPHPTSDFSNR